MNNFIVFEGVSGSGKTSISKEIAILTGGVYIKSPVEPFSFIRTRVEVETNPITQYLYYLANLQHLSDRITSMLLNTSVIVDKYLYTTLAYNKAINVDVNVPDFVRLRIPDYHFLLEVEERERLERIRKRDDNSPERTNCLLELERNIHCELKKFNPIIVNNNGDFNIVVNAIWSILTHKN